MACKWLKRFIFCRKERTLVPPRQVSKASRLPSIAAKMADLTGISGPEKQLMLRIGNLIDAFVITQRNLNNPGERGPRVLSNRVPAVRNLALRVMAGGIDASWDAVNFNSFQLYEVEHASNTTYVDGTVLSAFSNKISIKGFEAGSTVAIRVRVVDRVGNVGSWTSSETTTIELLPIFATDGDAVDFENRTRVPPSPELFGGASVSDAIARAFIGTGGAVGPSPITFYDSSNGGRAEIINQISYALIENDSIIAQVGVMGLPTLFYEIGDTVAAPIGREYMSFPGSFMDFFEQEELDFNPSVVNVSFLGYTEDPHEQSGIVHNACMATIKL